MVLKHGNLFGRHNHVVEADIQAFFDTIDHERLVKVLEPRIEGKQFLRLIRKCPRGSTGSWGAEEVWAGIVGRQDAGELVQSSSGAE